MDKTNEAMIHTPISGTVVSRRTIGLTASLALLGLGGSRWLPDGLTKAAAFTQNNQMSIALGVQTEGLPNDAEQIAAFNTLVSGQAAIALWFGTWSEPLINAATLNAIVAQGTIPMLTWEPWTSDTQREPAAFPLQAIADGEFDDYLQKSARDAAAWGQPFYLRLAHEMNGDWFPWGIGVNGNSPEAYIAAWRHIVTLFRDEGVDNARFVWAPNTEYDGDYPFTAYYPGDEWVDWVGLDGYNWGSQARSGWRSFSELFYPSCQTLTSITQKPMMIAEMACSELGGDKAGWIRQGLLTDLPTLMPSIRAVVWFNRNKETDWRVDSSETSLAAYQEVVASPLYRGGPTELIDTFGVG